MSALSLMLLMAPTTGVGLISLGLRAPDERWCSVGVMSLVFLNIDVRRSTSGRDVRWRASYFVLPVLWSKLRVVWFIS